ncbi:MAG: hypothetical protein JWO41_180 [Candidatus Saccharibacteria bacterium]|nr:hypothetical protein [Candidatus Saccharibacteria bacterium]
MLKKLLGLLAIAITIASPFGTLVGHASAISGGNFNAGHIIDDNIFTNSSSMSTADIQNFLNSKVPNCDTYGAQPTSHPNGSGGYYTRAQWGSMSSNPTPFTCLKDYVENTSTLQNNFKDPTTPVPGGVSAAQIIYDAAKKYAINPQVILVTLQKEQGLVTDDWPWYVQYKSAMGYGCPDTAACDSKYYGFYNQVASAAYQFRYYLDHPNAFNYWVGNNYIKYSPTSGCTGSNVTIINPATAALYIYTPYQPNASALANTNDSSAGGTGDSCGAYGNRNFWWYFTKWFGSTLGSYSWYTNGYKLLDQTGSYYIDPGQLKPGEKYLVDLAVVNTGTAVWSNTGYMPVRLGTTNGQGHNSVFCDSSWIACSRPAGLRESTVSPGETGHFNFLIQAPYIPGSYRDYFKPLAENFVWTNDSDQSLGIQVVNPGSYSWYTNGYKLLDQTSSYYVDPGQLTTNTRYYVDIAVINTGSATWSNSGATPVRFGTTNSQGHASALCDSTWLWCGRPATLRETTVAPGQTGHFNFYIKTPSTPGQFREYFKPLAENYAWTADSNQSLGIIVR